MPFFQLSVGNMDKLEPQDTPLENLVWVDPFDQKWSSRSSEGDRARHRYCLIEAGPEREVG